MTDTQPLAGVRIIEVASFVAGPTAGMALAQLGAQVVRVDPLGGGSDHLRWPVATTGSSYYWASLNKGKLSLTVNLRSERGRSLVADLVGAPGEGGGILIDNVVGRHWLSDAELASRRSDIIRLRVQGHPDGRPAVDYTVNAAVGLPGITGAEVAGAPVNHVLPAWDLVTGMTAATAVLAALHRRQLSGQGSEVRIALADVAVAHVANLGWLSEAADRGQDRPRQGNHVYGSFGVDFVCADGERVMVVALTEGQWAALCSVTGTTSVFDALEDALDADLNLEADRYRLRETIAAILRPWFAARTFHVASAELDAAHVLWSRYGTMTEVASRHLAGNYPVLETVRLPDGGQLITGRSPLRFAGSFSPAGDVPRLGQDTVEVLRSVLGLGEDDLRALREDAVISPWVSP